MMNEEINEEIKDTEEKKPEETNTPETEESDAKADKADKKKSKKLEAEIEKLKKELDAKGAELEAEKDKYLRMIAEYDNFRRRSAKERDGIYADAYGEAIASVFPVIDNLERAAKFSDAEKIQEGIALTLKGFADTLEKLGITEIGNVGDTFDPNEHNAVMHVEDESLGESVIVEVFQKGYKKGDKIIRYAMVKVAN